MLTAALIPLLLVAQEKAPEKASISGTVVHYATGEPLDKVEIEADPAGAHAVTDAKGRFLIANLEPGSYRLKGRRNRFLDTWYGSRRAEGNGTPIVIAPGDAVKDLQFKLIPFGVIAGTIRDSEGEPLARITVSALRLRYEEGRRRISVVESAITDDLGQYRLTGLAPGKYYLRADPRVKGATLFASGVINVEGGGLVFKINGPLDPGRPSLLMSSLYPGVQDAAAARAVDLDTGARVNGIDISLPRAAMVRVAGHVSAPARNLSGTVSLASGQSGNDLLGIQLSAGFDEKGNFEFPAVPPGEYILGAEAQAGESEPQGKMEKHADGPGSRGYSGGMPLHVGSVPLEGVNLVLGPGADVVGRVIKPDEKESGDYFVEFYGDTPDNGNAPVNGGEFHTVLHPGRYQPHVNNTAPGVYARSILADGRDILGEGLAIAGPGKVTVEITLAADSGKIGGTVADKEDKPVAGAIVVLVPEARLRARSNRFQQVEADQYGHFEITAVPPGEYKLFAWDDIEPGIWYDPDFLKTIESKGERVTLGSNGQETAKARVIP